MILYDFYCLYFAANLVQRYLITLPFYLLQDIQENWIGLNELAANDKDPMLKRIRRDGHCHEAVMW